MFSTKELTDMRADAALSQVSSCVIYRDTQVADSYGGSVETPAQVAATSCHVAPAGQSRGRQGLVGGAVATEASWTISVPVGTEVAERDVVDVAGLGRFVVQQVVVRSIATALLLYCNAEAA